MPIFVQWKWMERTKSFLVIFHFHDDGSKPNLRYRTKLLQGRRSPYLYTSEGAPLISPESGEIRTVMTWAPSHPEIGLFSELLSYANIINGFKETEKRKFRNKLELFLDAGNGTGFIVNKATPKEILDELFEGIVLLSIDTNKTGKPVFFACFELRQKYIDYLRKVLKPHLRSD